jgi:hypothetical protein
MPLINWFFASKRPATTDVPNEQPGDVPGEPLPKKARQNETDSPDGNVGTSESGIPNDSFDSTRASLDSVTFYDVDECEESKTPRSSLDSTEVHDCNEREGESKMAGDELENEKASTD